MREHEARHAIGERRLADAGRAADQPGMRDAAAAIGSSRRLLGRLVAEQRHRSRADAGRRGCSSASGTAALPGTAHVSSPAAARGAGSSRSVDLSPRCRRRPPRPGRSRIDHHAAVGLARRRSRGRRAQLLVKSSDPPPRSGRARRRRAALAARASPISAGTSRMKVRSGMASPTVIRSSARISGGSTCPSMP